jgi:hypothetical protein
MKVTKDNHYILAVLYVHGVFSPKVFTGSAENIRRLQTSINSIKSALFRARKGQKP